MGLADTVTKAYMKGNTVFADAFNYLIYGGKAVVNPAQLQELDTTEIALPFGEIGCHQARWRSGLHPFGYRKPNRYSLCNACS